MELWGPSLTKTNKDDHWETNYGNGQSDGWCEAGAVASLCVDRVRVSLLWPRSVSLSQRPHPRNRFRCYRQHANFVNVRLGAGLICTLIIRLSGVQYRELPVVPSPMRSVAAKGVTGVARSGHTSGATQQRRQSHVKNEQVAAPELQRPRRPRKVPQTHQAEQVRYAHSQDELV